jgi:hypothetical protein
MMSEKDEQQQWVVDWENQFTGASCATLHLVEHFDARGMRKVYGRGDHFHRVFNMGIWRTRAGRLLVRFGSRNGDVDGECWEIIGVPDAQEIAGPPFDDRWIPNCLREAYITWIIANF